MWLINSPGVNIEHQDEDGFRAIHFACKLKNYVVFDELLKHQADIGDTISNK